MPAGFQTTTFPISAAEVVRFAAIAVKLNGETAKTNPSSGRYSIRFHTPGDDSALRIDPRHELDVEAEEVDRLAGGVDLGLVCGLRLAEHRRGVQRVAPRAREELGGAQQHGGTLLPRPARPVVPARARMRRSPAARARGALVHVGEDVILVVRHHRRLQVAGHDVLAVDHERDLDPLVLHLLEAPLEPLALG